MSDSNLLLPPILLFLLILIVGGIFQCWKFILQAGEQEQAALRERQRIGSPQILYSVPTVDIITEIVHRKTQSRLTRNELELLAAIGQTFQSTPNGSSQASEAPTTNKPPIKCESISHYESPPNFEESLTLLNGNQKQKNLNTQIT